MSDESSTANPAELAMLLQQRAEPWIAANGGGYSLAIWVTDGTKPGDGTVVGVKTGRYAQDSDVTNPDEQAAYEERQRIREAITQHLLGFGAEDAMSELDVDDLTDNIVAELAGE